MMTDPIADMLSRIRNANRALHDQVEMPNSRMKEGIARLLKEEGYIRDYHVENGGSYKRLVIDLKYSRSRERVITNLKARTPYLCSEGPPAARAGRHGRRDLVHLERPDHEPNRSGEGRRRRGRLFYLVKVLRTSTKGKFK
jgi:hypothetical protein